MLGENQEQQQNEVCKLVTQTQQHQQTKVLLGYPQHTAVHTDKHLCAPVPQARDAEEDLVSMLRVSQREKGQVTSTTQILPENRYWLCSPTHGGQRAFNGSTADRLDSCSHSRAHQLLLPHSTGTDHE